MKLTKHIALKTYDTQSQRLSFTSRQFKFKNR